MSGSGWGWCAAALGSAVALALLLFPFRIPPAHPMADALGSALHVLLFAGLAWLWARCLPHWARGGLLWVGLVLVSAGVEWTQAYIGRSAEFSDWLYGMAGSACICLTWRFRFRTPFRWAALLVFSLIPLSWAMTMAHMEAHSFPTLADPEAIWARQNWILNGVRPLSILEKGFRWEANPQREGDRSPSYPGVFRTPASPDWRQIHSFNTDIFWPDPPPAVFAVRVDDQPGNPSYAERFQKEFVVTQGWNRVEIPVDELRRTPGGHCLDLESITQWGVFLVSETPLDYFLLGTVRVEQLKEQP